MAEGYKFHGKTQIRKWLKEELRDLGKEYGFKMGKAQGCPSAFIRDGGSYFTYNIFDVYSDDLVRVGNLHLRLNDVEEKLTSVLGIDTNFHTVILFNDKLLELRIISEIEISRLVAGFKEVFINQHLPFIEKYADNPAAVLELWDSLDEDGKVNTFWDPNMRAKSLIIARMVGDDKFEERVAEGLSFYNGKLEMGKSAFQEYKDNFVKVADYLRNE